MQITLDVRGNTEVQQKLKRLGESLLIMPAAMREIADKTTKYYENEVFNSQGGILGLNWQRLAPSTTRAKTKNYRQFSNVPLMASGRMRESFVAASTPTSVTISNTAPYFIYHQSTATRYKLPRRAMMGINEPIRELIRDAVTKEIRNKLSR